MADPLVLALDGFIATLFATSLVYTRKTIRTVRGQTERPWLLIFFSVSALFFGSVAQFYADALALGFVSPFLVSAVPSSILLVAGLVYGYRYVIGNNLLIELIIQRLKAGGFRTKRDGKLVGRSGAEHPFDVVGERDDLKIVVDVKTSMLDVGEIPVLQLFMKSLDAAVVQPVLVVMPGITRLAQKYATSYRLNVLEGRSNDVILRELDTLLENVLKPTPTGSEGKRASLEQQVSKEDSEK